MFLANYGQEVQDRLNELYAFGDNHDGIDDIPAWEATYNLTKQLWLAIKADPQYTGIMDSDLLHFCMIILNMQESAEDSGYKWEDFLKILFGD